jgi:signal transduction histidine kinase
MCKIQYIYGEKISVSFSHKIAKALAAGETVVLIGPRYVGKRYVLSRVLDQLCSKEGVTRDRIVVGSLLETQPDTIQTLAGATLPADPFLDDLGTVYSNVDQVLTHFDAALRDPAEGKIALMVANADARPWTEVEAFLHSLAELAGSANRKPGILLTFEIHGPDLLSIAKEWLVADKVFVLQEFDTPEFAQFAERYLESLRLETRGDRQAIIAELNRQTGGRIYFLRCLLWSYFDQWASQEGREKPPLSLESIVAPPVIEHIPWNHYFRYVTRLISRAPDLWPALLELKRFGEVRLDFTRNGEIDGDDGPPSLLELAGIARREHRDDGPWLKVSGTLVSEFLDRHYTPQRIAELHSLEGDWARAFEGLRVLQEQDPKKLIRPSSIDDVVDTDHAARRLGASLYQLISLDQLDRYGSRVIRQRFADGCRLLLGYDEVTFWVRNRPGRSGWKRLETRLKTGDRAQDTEDCTAEGDPPSRDLSYYQPILDSLPEFPREGPAGYLPLDGDLGFAAQIGSPHSDLDSAVIVRAELSKDLPPRSKAGQEILEVLLRDFLQAHHQAKQIARAAWQGAIRNQLSQVIMDVLRLLGSEVQSLDQAMAKVAERLRSKPFGYKRVLISLVDPGENAIVGAYEDSDDPQRTMRGLTHYPLDQPEKSLHAWAIQERKFRRELNLPEVEGVQEDTIRATKAIAGAVIPLLFVPAEDKSKPIPLGTLWCERADALAPSEEEAIELEEFGKKLAVALVQSKRVHLLQSALDLQRQPMMILDGKDRPVFANEAAVKLIPGPIGQQDAAGKPNPAPVKRGWRDYEVGTPNPLDPLNGKFVDELRKSLERTRRPGRQVRQFDANDQETGRDGDSRPPDTVSMLTNVIGYRGNRPAESDVPVWGWKLGTVCEIQRQRILYRVFEALKRLYKATGDGTNASEPGRRTEHIIEEVGLLLTEVLGHSRAVLYQIDRADPTTMNMRSIYSREPVPPVFRAEHRQIRLDEGQRWLSLEAGEPVALTWRSDLEGGDPVLFTKDGLRVNVLVNPAIRSLLTNVGEMTWIDFPLRAGDDRWGMIVLSCDPGYLPEDFEFLKVFERLVSSLLEGAQEEDRRFREKIVEAKAEANKAQGILVHNVSHPLNEFLGSLPTKAVGLSDDPELVPFYQQVKEFLCSRVEDLRKLRDKLRLGRQLEIERFDLIALVRALLRERTADFDWAFYWEPEFLGEKAESLIEEQPALDGAMTSSVSEFQVDFDRPEMRVVLENILRNARENFARGDGRLRVEVVLREVQRWGTPMVRLGVRDNGPGIKLDEGLLSQVFEAYYSRHADGEKGRGLGLSHAKDILLAHGGSILADNPPEGGALFVLEFPRYQLSPSRREAEPRLDSSISAAKHKALDELP